MADDVEEGGEAPCWSHLLDELDDPGAVPSVLSSNTIIYCARWPDVVAFYRRRLGLRPTMERDWFVEFEVHPGAHLSVADASRTTVVPGDGSGLTLSWRVADLEATRARLTERGVEVSTVRNRWGSRCIDVFDPAGNRIEFWTDDA